MGYPDFNPGKNAHNDSVSNCCDLVLRLKVLTRLFSDQINICWATAENPIANVSEDRLNETFSSLSSARPSASSLTFDIAALTATSTPASSTASATSSPASSGASATPSETSSQSPAPTGGSSGVSGGAIGGAVVGGVVGLALIGAGIFFLMRRKSKKAHQNELDGANPYIHNGYAGVAQAPPQEKYAHEAASEAPSSSYPPVEMPANTHPMEMEGSKPANNSQLHHG